MRNSMAFIFTALAGLAMSAPAPYPVTVNSRAQTAPPVIAYRGNESVFRVSFVDGSTASDLTGVVPFMAWATNASATVNSTSTYAVVGSATNGVVDFTFSPASVNYAPYRYMYEVGVKSTSGVPRVYRQGTFTIAGSPIGGGASAFVGTTNVSWAAYNWIGLPSWLLPADTNGWETGSHAGLATTGDVAQAIAAIPTSDAYTVRDSTDTNRWWRFEGTQAVQYALGALTTNYTVTLSEDFLETVGNTRPAWTNNVFPIVDSVWVGLFTSPTTMQFGKAEAATWNYSGAVGAVTLLAPSTEDAQGTATVYQHIYYPTNATGNVLGPVPTNLMSQAQVEAWWATVSPGYATTQALVAAVAPLAPTNAPVLLNPSVSGGLTLRNIMPTNLVLRLVCSNEHIYVEEVYP